MALKLKAKTPIAFEIEGEGITVTLSSLDDEATLLRKLKRIIGLVEPREETSLLMTGAVTVNSTRPRGAVMAEPPQIPDHLKGVIELDAPAEPVIGNGWGEGPPRA